MNKIINKKLIIIIGLILFLILLIIGIIIFWRVRLRALAPRPTSQSSKVSRSISSAPSFLTVVQKQKLGISTQLKVQALKRNARGQLMVYRIIKSNSDIIYNPSKIAPILPVTKK